MANKLDSNCVFCKIVKGEIPSTIVYKDDKVTAFKDLDPVAPVHILIVPNEHIESLKDCTADQAEMIGYILLVAAKIAKAQGIEESGYRVITNVGKDAGQSVLHMHFHLLGGRPLQFRNQ